MKVAAAGINGVMQDTGPLQPAINIHEGKIVHEAVSNAYQG
jgi:alanine dehydrogenase